MNNLEENLDEDTNDDSEDGDSEEELEEESIEDIEGPPEDLEEELEKEPTDNIEDAPEDLSEEGIIEDLEEELEKESIEDIKDAPEDLSEEELIEGVIEKDGEGSEEGIEGKSTEELGEECEGSQDELDEESDEEKAARIERQLRDFQRNLIEASLYAAGKPISVEELYTKLEIPKKRVEELINELAFDYLDRSTALIIAQMGDRYQMQIKPEYTEKVSKFAKGGAIAEKYLRTLTIIALKQPIMKSMVIKLRGSGAYEHVKYLIENGFIEAQKKGRSHELMTSDKYAEMFGLPKDKGEMKRVMISQLGLGDEQENPQ